MEQLENGNTDMSGTEVVAGPILQILIPKGIDFIWNKIIGKKILICGMGRSGKTSFHKYLMRGILLKERKTEKTIEHKNLTDAKIQLSNKSTFLLRIKKSTDSPGQLGTIEQATSVAEFKPNYIFIFLDCSRIEASKEWFVDFCENLDSKFKTTKNLSKKIKNIFIVLNKYDKIQNNSHESVENIYDKFSEEIKNIAEENLNHSYFRSSNKRSIPHIFPSICVKTKSGTEQVDELINNLASNI